jgi:phosphoserine phosphatase
LDVDRTLTREKTVYGTGLEKLRKHNHLLQIDSNFRLLREAVKEVDSIANSPHLSKEQIEQEIKQGFEKIVHYLVKFEVNHSQMANAGYDLAIETPPRYNTSKFLLGLKQREINTALISGSFKDWVIPWWLYHLSIRGIEVITTELGYDRNGRLTGRYKERIGAEKVEPAFEYIRRRRCTPELTIAVNDDFVIDGRGFLFSFGFGKVFLIGEGKKREFEVSGIKYEGKLEIVEEANDDLDVLTPKIDKEIRENAIPRIFTAEELYKQAVEGQIMRTLLERSKEEEGKKLNSTISEILKSCERFFSLQRPEILTEIFNVRGLYTDLKISLYREDDRNILRERASELCAVLFEENPELQLKDDYIEELSHLKS